MIYVSSACIKTDSIINAVNILSKNGFKNIELSGGAKFEERIVEKLLDLKSRYNLNYLCHNYFPPPEEPFVINLASLNENIYRRSLEFLKSSIKISKMLGASKFGFHAGFYFDMFVCDIGKVKSEKQLLDQKACLNCFIKGFLELKNLSEKIELYVENNVVSEENYSNFASKNPFMLTHAKEYFDMRKHVDFNLLLDIGHLKVSSKTLSFDFRSQLEKLLPHSEYLHISDNDAIRDLNKGLESDSEMIDILRNFDFRKKDITLEINEEINYLKQSYDLVRSFVEC